MTWTYAAASPWLKLEHACGPGSRDVLGELFAMMTGQSGHRSRRNFGSWAMWGGPPWGPMWAGGGRGPKARRGDVRAAILAVLAEQPRNGYQVIQEIAERSGGVWKPSPGSIYPTLQQLEDEGLVRAESDGGRRTYALTEEGQAYVAEHPDEVAAPWEAMGEASDDEDGLKPLIGQVAAAIWQIAAVGTPEQQAKGRDALRDLRRRLHAILAEDEPSSERR